MSVGCAQCSKSTCRNILAGRRRGPADTSPHGGSGASRVSLPAVVANLPLFEPSMLNFGAYRLQLAAWTGLGLVVDAVVPQAGHPPVGASAPVDYMNDLLLTDAHREQFFGLVDRVGLVVCKNVGGDDHLHRDVKGRSSRGRLSQGEFFHHDGCSGPVKPRVVEIRCPYQEVARHTATAIAPYPEVLYAMLLELRPDLRAVGELEAWHTQLLATGELPIEQWDSIQGALNRTLRRALRSEAARAYFRNVDVRAGGYREPWEMGECRFIANANGIKTMQHRRAYIDIHDGGRANGRLLKRWPADPHLEHD
ncbi:MAG: hypothetical protein KBG15_03335 [Kofleriaceae bacterium]|nr:hypothetical protein [Kofleriaceae bacterium]